MERLRLRDDERFASLKHSVHINFLQQWVPLWAARNFAYLIVRQAHCESTQTTDLQAICNTISHWSVWKLACVEVLFCFRGILRQPSGVYAAALNQLTRSLACEWARDGIRVNAVAPWFAATPLVRQALQDDGFRQGVLARTPHGRIAEPEETSGAPLAALSCPCETDPVMPKRLAIPSCDVTVLCLCWFYCGPNALVARTP